MKYIATLIISLFTLTAFSQSASDDFSGKWLSKDNEVLTIKKEGGYFVGYNNKNFKVIYDVKFDDGEWTGRGKDPVTGISAGCELSFEESKLKVRGGIGFLKTSHYFTRIKN